MNRFSLLLIVLFALSCNTRKPTASLQAPDNWKQHFPKSTTIATAPAKRRLWVFLLAGQSNMAGRGFVEPQDTITSERLLTINASGQVILAKEPLHFYEPSLTGLDCGLSFGKALLDKIPDSISLLLIPTAIGGSSISHWFGDSVYRNVQLLTNFRQKVETGKQYGQVKAILWHQGESDANDKGISQYASKLAQLTKTFRGIVGNDSLPILMGELGSFSKNKQQWQSINEIIRSYSLSDKYTAVISTSDLKHKGDSVHFNSDGQRAMGRRFANVYIDKFR